MTVDLVLCAATPWTGDPSRCKACDGPLSGRQTSWCSALCRGWFARQHIWTSARRAALRRDEHRCVVCQREPQDVYVAKLASGVALDEARRFLVLQVDHIVQVLGRHGETGCHHHLDGLRTLCAWHHLARHHGRPDQRMLI